MKHHLTSISLLLFVSLFVACNPKSPKEAVLAPGDTVNIAIMTTTDLHGWVLPFDYASDSEDQRYGLAKVATIVDSVRGIYPNNLLIDAGDWLQGNQFAEYFARIEPEFGNYPLLKAAEKMNFDAFVLGNHEFNFGIDYLNKRISQTTIPILGANIYEHGTKNPVYTPYIIRNISGVRTAVIGLTTPGSAVWDRPRVEGVLDFGDGLEAARRFVEEVQGKGAEFIIILAHSGLEPGSSYNTDEIPEENFGRLVLENVDGIHLLAFGHSHRVTENTYITGPSGVQVPVIQAGRWGSHLGVATFTLTRDDSGTLKILDQSTVAHSVRDVAVHEEVAKLVEQEHQRVRDYVNAVLAATDDIWDATNARASDNPIVDLIHHVQLEVTGAQLSAASAFNTNARWQEGTISRRDLAMIYPYENMLYTMEISGSQLKDFLEHTSRYYTGTENGQPVVNPNWPGFNFDTIAGVDYEIDIRRPVGQRITRLRHNGNNVRPDDTFTIAINSYRAEGGGGFSMLRGAPILWTSDISVRSYMEKFLEERDKLNQDEVFVQNWRLVY